MASIYERRNLSLPIVSGLFYRPRIAGLLKQGLSNPIMVIKAAPGYGKTIETAGYLSKAPVRLAWMRVTQLDNLPSHFWDNLTASLSQEFPISAERLKAIGYPDTLAKADACIHALANDFYSGATAVLVIDDYDKIHNQEIRLIFEYMIELGMENLCLILIVRKGIDMIGLRGSGEISTITTADLAFTAAETYGILKKYNSAVTSDLADKIYRDTDGWPLMVSIISHQLKKQQHSYTDIRSQSLEAAYIMYENECFSAYSNDLQLLLIRLSLFYSFPSELIKKLCRNNIAEAITMLKDNMFVVHNYTTHEYSFLNFYREFLISKQIFLAKKDKITTYGLAGDCVLEYNLLAAAEYYSLGQRYDDMLLAIIRFIGEQMVISRSDCLFLRQNLERLPKEIAKENMLAGYIKACLFIQELQPEKALGVLVGMEKILLAEGTPQACKMLGEVYERMAGIHMMLSRECFMDFYQLACNYIPDGSAFKQKNMLRFKNYSLIAMEGSSPGALKRMEQTVHKGISYMKCIENGAAAGFQYLFSAETAIAAFNLDRAKKMVEMTIVEGQADNQYDIVSNAFYLKAQIAYLQGNYFGMTSGIEALNHYLNTINVPEMDDMITFGETWLCLCMNDFERLPGWIYNADSALTKMLPLAIGREETLYSVYLLMRQQYKELIAYLEPIKNWYKKKGAGDWIYAQVRLAIAYYHLGEETKALETLLEAYHLTYHNYIVTPFIEAGSHMLELINLIRQSEMKEFDPLWIAHIYSKADEFNQLRNAMIKEHKKAKHLKKSKTSKLSNRELNVLEDLTIGMTREEIATQNYISVNTVKSTITSIYNKLGAVNRADAVRIGIAEGILKI